MPRRLEIERFTEAVEIVHQRFLGLRIEVASNLPDALHAAATIPEQPGLRFAVSIDLQNLDELHLEAGAFHVEWFPCGEPDVFGCFVDALVGLLAGDWRILEHVAGATPVKAELQRPLDAGWQTVATWSTLRGLLPWKRSTRVIRNCDEG